MAMEQEEHVGALLRAARPEPSDVFVARLERRLLGAPARERRRRPLLAGLAGALGLAAALIVVALAGVGPFGTGNGEVRAKATCTTVRVPGTVTTPVLVRGHGGASRIELRRHRGVVAVRRCSRPAR